jgi:uncharacterized protein YhfF
MPLDKAKCKAYWFEFIESLAVNDSRRWAKPDAFGFGGDGQIADELAALLLTGRKRATASLPVEYTALGEPLPKAGDLSIILNGAGDPIAIIERTRIDLVPFLAVRAEFAAREGEGDGTLEYWREVHTGYFSDVCERLGGKLEDDTPVLCQSFSVVWPPAASDVASA